MVKASKNKSIKAKESKSPFSVHVTADFHSSRPIVSVEELKKLLFQAAKAANNTPLKCCIQKFPVRGMTGVLVLAESHIAIHTWPEHQYIAIDLFTCGKDTQPIRAMEYLKKILKPKKAVIRHIRRGGV
ncbi:MAG: adenosylmethionine decarboxylase [Candidatus Omnitrophica bacterium]|nr:adenosylmethionine decarboxylase [Candidatus Omnitrophota bacterium]